MGIDLLAEDLKMPAFLRELISSSHCRAAGMPGGRCGRVDPARLRASCSLAVMKLGFAPSMKMGLCPEDAHTQSSFS